MDISYNKNHSEVNKFIYDSQTGTLINHEKRAKILLSNKEKEDIYSYFTQQEFSSQCISVIHQDSTSSKITIDLKKIKNENEKCSESKKDIKKLLLLYAKIHTLLRSKNEYKEVFPPMDEY